MEIETVTGKQKIEAFDANGDNRDRNRERKKIVTDKKKLERLCARNDVGWRVSPDHPSHLESRIPRFLT